jgi:hypothetical protein
MLNSKDEQPLMGQVQQTLNRTATSLRDNSKINSPITSNNMYGIMYNMNHHFRRITINGIMDFSHKSDTFWAEASSYKDPKLYEMCLAELDYESQLMGYDAIFSHISFKPIAELVKFINTYPDLEFQKDVKKKFSDVTSFMRNGLTTAESFFNLFDEHNVLDEMNDYIAQQKEYFESLSKTRKQTMGSWTKMATTRTNNYKSGNAGTSAARLAEEARLATEGEEEADEDGFVGDTAGGADKAKKDTKPPATKTVNPPWSSVSWHPTEYPNVQSSSAKKYSGLVPVKDSQWIKVTAENRVTKKEQELVYRYTAVKEPCARCSDTDATKHHKGSKCYCRDCFKCKLYGHQSQQCLQL